MYLIYQTQFYYLKMHVDVQLKSFVFNLLHLLLLVLKQYY